MFSYLAYSINHIENTRMIEIEPTLRTITDCNIKYAIEFLQLIYYIFIYY